MLVKPSQDAIATIVRAALQEDAPWGDLSSAYFIPPEARITAHLAAREPGVLAGEDVFTAAMHLTDPTLTVTFHIHDSEPFEAGTHLATIAGSAQSILQAERVALNFTQRLSGIATLTARYVAAIANTKARIVDTRKTTPNLRLLERYAVRCGGGHNHRFSLSDAVMLKDNHLAILTANGQRDLTQSILAARAHLPHTTHLEIEVDHPSQIEPVLAAHPDTILLDNFTTEQLAAAVQQIKGRALIEASGNVTLERLPEIAATGVDIISSGALTHSARALDLSLDVLPDGPPARGALTP